MVAVAEYVSEIWTLVVVLIPQLLQLYAFQTVGRLSLALVGHYDGEQTHIAAAVLGNMYSNITGFSLGVALALALSAYCSQNQGRGMQHENGVALRQCFKVLVATFPFPLLAAWGAKPLLGALGQPEALLEPCRLFSLIQCIALPPLLYAWCISAVLASQYKLWPGLVQQLLSSFVQLMSTWYMLSQGVGYLSVAWGRLAGAVVGSILMYTYVVTAGMQATVWRVPGKLEARLTMREYWDSALPSAIGVWAEWWAAEVMAVFAGWLPGSYVSTAAHGLLFNTLMVFYMTFTAVQRCTTIRIGELMGSLDLERIPVSIAAALVITLALASGVAVLLLIYGEAIISLYTDDSDIIKEATDANLGVVLSIPPYSVLMAVLGIMRAVGMQKWGAVLCCVSFYVVGLPVSYTLGLHTSMDLLGIWLGNVAALCTGAVGGLVKVALIDWPVLMISRPQKGQLPSFDIASATPTLDDLPTVFHTPPLLQGDGASSESSLSDVEEVLNKGLRSTIRV
eukprot:TRINITY_DN58874_c0_g1_i1.p1 TRINITY_DN58874_c0_g1~~TRINITY_DN58874_c0_g1_i1.p1  ORF type:complete len:509 (+),score=80.10 TRINITY_DN58874_c0_g1_i1:70-1596(+)